MFSDFLYLLRQNGLNVSMTEWMALMEGLDKGLHAAGLTGFYFLSRAVLVKSEADFDQFDRCFLEYFKDVPFEQEVSQELMDWLERPNAQIGMPDEQQAQLNELLTEDEIEQMFKERMIEQREQHNLGTYWVGTHGNSVFGNSGFSPNGIRVGGKSIGKRAFRVAGERKFRDFRGDNTLDTRQLQVALRHLRQFSGLVDLPPTEFDVDNTIKDTCSSGGILKVRYKRPRQNTVKVLLLMDSGGSMDYYSQICSALFQAMGKTRHFKDLKVYYFHNCILSSVYSDPTLSMKEMISTEWLLNNITPEYKVIFVGDAQMAPHELNTPYHYKSAAGENARRSGLEWLEIFKCRYASCIWLNPSERSGWGWYWNETYDTIGTMFPFFPLTVDGLEEGMKKLLSR